MCLGADTLSFDFIELQKLLSICKNEGCHVSAPPIWTAIFAYVAHIISIQMTVMEIRPSKLACLICAASYRYFVFPPVKYVRQHRRGQRISQGEHYCGLSLTATVLPALSGRPPMPDLFHANSSTLVVASGMPVLLYHHHSVQCRLEAQPKHTYLA